jgi:REP element-mobilizing transposase RayT
MNDDIVRLNKYGEIMLDCIHQIPLHFKNAENDEWIVMPNHVHGIIRLLDSLHSRYRSRRDVACNVSTKTNAINVSTKTNAINVSTKNVNQNTMSVISPRSDSLSTIVRSFKSVVTNRIHAAGFNGDVWQPRFHDHIIRNDRELNAIRRYIKKNPANWNLDREIVETDETKFGKQPWVVHMR